jgi:hypothetical protein
LAWQICGLVAILSWCIGMSVAIFGTLKLFGLIGVNAETQIFGQDSQVHGEPGYGEEDRGNNNVLQQQQEILNDGSTNRLINQDDDQQSIRNDSLSSAA